MDILDILKTDEQVSGESIARMLNISRSGVHKKMQKLRKLGYGITGTNKSGYLLVSRPDIIDMEELKYYFRKYGVPKHAIHCYSSVGSTQDEAKTVAEKGGEFPAIIIAEKQTGSYGRRRREWAAPEGGLWFSLVLKPSISPEKIPQITFAASLAVCRAVEVMLGLSPLIKWPNDVTLNGKKFSGILTEMSAEVGRLNWVIVGIGIDVNNSIPAVLKNTAVNLSAAAGKKINRPELLASVLSEFYGLYEIFLTKGFEGFRKEYNKKSLLNGAEVNVDGGDGVINGIVRDIDGDGYLRMKTGIKMVKIIAGDVVKVIK